MKPAIHFLRKHHEFTFALCFVLIVATILGTAYGLLWHATNKQRNQAIARAKRMDGKEFTINAIGYNWFGDTRLFLKDKNGNDAGWIMMYMSNPLNDKINPLFLLVVQRTTNNPLPLKVRSRFREKPWTNPNVKELKEGYTGSYLDFEIVKGEL